MIQQDIQRYFRAMPLQKRLFSYFIIVCFIPLLIIGSISILLSINSTRKSAIKFSESTMLQVKTRTETIMELAYTRSQQLTDDLTVQRTLRKPLERDISARFQTDLAMDTYLNYELNYINNIYGFYIVGENKSAYKSAYNSFYTNDLTTTLWYQLIMESDDPIWFSAHKNSLAVKTAGQFFVSMGMKIKDKASSRDLGVILVEIELEKLEKILKDSFGDFGQVMIIDEKNRIIASSSNLFDTESRIFQGVLKKEESFIGPENEAFIRNSLLLSKKLTNSNWKLVAVIPISSLLQDGLISIIILIGLLVLISIFTYSLSRLITQTITKPIDNMIELMEKVDRDNIVIKADIEEYDEISRLNISFNEMTNKVQTLMDKSIEEQQKLRKAELHALQSQINPHFLYNTLDSVVWLARMKQYEDIIKIVSAITKLFRISLSRGNDIISIEEEIQHVTNYLLIQKFRYKTQFDYKIHISEGILHYKTLKLILQPLVENSIYHGIKLKRSTGHISIEGYEHNNNIILKVHDTGIGMSKETLEGIHFSFKNNGDPRIKMYGIKNVNERIGIFFGKEFGLKFESEWGVGTTATITIPKYKGDELNVKNNNH